MTTYFSAWPPTPDRNDPDNFAVKAQNFMGHFPTWTDEAEVFAVDMNGLKVDVIALKADTQGIKDAAVTDTQAITTTAMTYRDQAEGYKDEAEIARDAALASANYVGVWANLTGALNAPAMVYHENAFWVLLSNLADVTLKEPGIDVEWAGISASGGKPIGEPDWPVTLSYTDGSLTEAVYAKSNMRYKQTLGYTSGTLTTVVYALSFDSGTTYGNIGTETLNYTDGVLTSTSWAAA